MKTVIYTFLAILLLLCRPSYSAYSQNHSTDLNKSSDYFIEGVREYNNGDYPKATELFEECLALNPHNDAAAYYLAMMGIGYQNSTSAVDWLNHAISLDPENAWYKLTLARIYSNTGDTDQAIAIYKELIEKNPNKTDYYYELTDLLVNSKNYKDALTVIEDIEQLRGPNELTVTAKYELYMMQGQYQEALQAALTLDEEFPSVTSALTLGEFYKNMGEDATALFYLDKSLAIDSTYTLANLEKAGIYLGQRNFPKAFENLNIFFSDERINPTYKVSYMEDTFFSSGMVDFLRPQLDNLVEILLTTHPQDTTILTFSSSYFVSIDSTDRATELLKQNLELNPEKKSAWRSYLVLLYYLRDWDSLIPLTDEALGKFPDDIELMELLAISLWQDNRESRAIEVYEDIIPLAKGEPGMLVHCYSALGDLYHSTGNPRRAFKSYEQGLKIDRNYNPILNNYAYYLSLRKQNLKKAIEMSRKTIENEPDNATYLDTYGYLMYLTGNYQEAREYLKRAVINGGNQSAVVLDHYAEALFALGEYNLALLYWNNAEKINTDADLARKIAKRQQECKQK